MASLIARARSGAKPFFTASSSIFIHSVGKFSVISFMCLLLLAIVHHLSPLIPALQARGEHESNIPIVYSDKHSVQHRLSVLDCVMVAIHRL